MIQRRGGKSTAEKCDSEVSRMRFCRWQWFTVGWEQEWDTGLKTEQRARLSTVWGLCSGLRWESWEPTQIFEVVEVNVCGCDVITIMIKETNLVWIWKKKNCGSPSKKLSCLILCVNYSEPQDTQGAGETLFLVVSVRVFLEQISIWTGGLSEPDGPLQCEWVSPVCWRPK